MSTVRLVLISAEGRCKDHSLDQVIDDDGTHRSVCDASAGHLRPS